MWAFDCLKQLRTIAFACFSPLILGGFPAGALARPVVDFNPDSPKYAELNRQYDAASELEDKANSSADKRGEVIAAFQATINTASKMRLSDGSPHPLAAAAEIKLASQLRENGEIKAIIPLLRSALVALSPYRSFYFRTYTEGTAFLAQSLSETGNIPESLTILEHGVQEYEEWFAAGTESRRSSASWMAKSNLEYSYAYALFRSGLRDRAVEVQRKTVASRIAAVGENSPDTASAHYWLANFLLRAGHSEEAEKEARHAVEIVVAHASQRHPSYARAMEVLALVLSDTGRAEEATEYLRRSLEVKTANGDKAYLSYASHNLATALVDLERYDEARELLSAAVETMRSNEGKSSPQVLNSLSFAGLSALGLSNLDVAKQELELVRSELDAIGIVDPVIRGRAIPPLILALAATGDMAKAHQMAQAWAASLKAPDPAGQTLAMQALALEAYTAQASPAELDAAAERLLNNIDAGRVAAANGQLGLDQRLSLDIVLRMAVQSGNADLGLKAMDLLAGSKVALASRLVAARMLSDDAKLASSVRSMQDLAKAAQEADRELLAAWARDKDVDTAKLAQQVAQNAWGSSRADLAQNYPQWTSASAVRPPSLADVKASLKSDEAILGVVPAFEGVFILTITKNGETLRRAELGRAAITAMAQSLRLSIESRNFDPKISHRLYEVLFSQSERKALNKVKLIKVVSSGALAGVPFSLLITKPTETIDSKSPWLLRQFAIAVQSDFSAQGGSEISGANVRSFLGIGAPMPFGGVGQTAAKMLSASHYFRGGVANEAALATLPTLPNAEGELLQIAQRFGAENSKVLTGAAANELALKSDALDRYGTIMFATHGLVGGRTEGGVEPSLVLSPPSNITKDTSDGLLSASEISQLRLDADWVILSACNTAAGGVSGSEAYAGLAQAFLYAGSRSLLVSHWPLRDDAATYLTVRAVDAARKGANKAQALRKAQLALIADSSIADSSDPFIWAPFVLIAR